MIWFDTPDNTVTTIDTLYKYSKGQNITLFPTEDYDFWEPYEANYQEFDRYFYQKFRAFEVIQEYPNGTPVADMLADWKQIIDAHLFINQKRYSELYRVQVLPDNAYDIVNNYDLHETAQRKNTGTQTDAIGGRQDSTQRGAGSTSTQYGAKSESTQYGARNDQNVYGSRTDTNSTTLGQQTSDSTQQRSAFNSSAPQTVAAGSIANGSRQDSASLTTGSHTDTASIGGHTDTRTEQARTDTTTEAPRTDTATIGAQSNQRTDNLQEDTTLHRYGNIGVQTAAEIIAGHERLWDAFKFYQMIFDEIAEEYLVIDVDFDFIGG